MLAIDRRIRERGLDSEFKVSYHFRNIFGKKQSCFDWIRAVNAIAKKENPKLRNIDLKLQRCRALIRLSLMVTISS